MNMNIKTGACSIILGSGHYGGFIDARKNKLFKITKLIQNHNETKHLEEIRSISDYRDYFAIPDETRYSFNPGEPFYEYLRNLTRRMDMTIFYGQLQGFYIDYAGENDLFDIINSPYTMNNLYKLNRDTKVLDFARQIMTGLSFLHGRKICHLDIKPENIMVMHDIGGQLKFKIIDFGFASKEPFDDFADDTRGTPTYFPKNIDNIDEPGLPLIRANDMIEEANGELPFNNDRTLIYRIDSYAFGRVLGLLWFHVKSLKGGSSCFRKCRFPLKGKIENMINLLTENDCRKRLTITHILNLLFV